MDNRASARQPLEPGSIDLDHVDVTPSLKGQRLAVRRPRGRAVADVVGHLAEAAPVGSDDRDSFVGRERDQSVATRKSRARGGWQRERKDESRNDRGRRTREEAIHRADRRAYGDIPPTHSPWRASAEHSGSLRTQRASCRTCRPRMRCSSSISTLSGAPRRPSRPRDGGSCATEAAACRRCARDRCRG